MRKLYRHVDVLNANGFGAVLAHREDGFVCRWFEHRTKVGHPPEVWPPRRGDILLVPESLAWEIQVRAPGVPKVIFNQNPYETFLGRTDPRMPVPYVQPDVLATLVVSEDSEKFFRYAFPQHKTYRIHNGIDPTLYFPGPFKRRQIAYMPRKGAYDGKQVISLLECRGVLRDFHVTAIENRSEAETAAILRESVLFMSFSTQEGCALPPLEAVACGCIVVGYDGLGCREYFRPPWMIPVPQEDVVALAQAVESILTQLRKDPTPLGAMVRQGGDLVKEWYSPAREEADIVAAWKDILSKIRA